MLLVDTVDKPIVLDLNVLALILTVIIPLVTGLITKVSAPPWLKSLVTVVLAFVVGTIQTLMETDGGVIEHPRAWITATVTSFVVAIATYYGFLKPTTIAPKVASITGDAAIGPKQP